MRIQEVFIYLALALIVSAFFIAHWRKNRAQLEPYSRPRVHRTQRATKSPMRYAGDLLPVIASLRNSHAQWEQIFSVLNPDSDATVHALLLELRGPHMFDPRTGLGVIETGFREVSADATVITALQAAKKSMNRVLSLGD